MALLVNNFKFISTLLALSLPACVHTKDKAPPLPPPGPPAVGAPGQRGMPPAPPPGFKPQRAPDPATHASAMLHRAYDRVTAAAELPEPPEAPVAPVLSTEAFQKLLAQAKQDYTRSVSLYGQKDFDRALHLAGSADAAADGLIQLVLAERPLPSDVPEPPAAEARRSEPRVRDHLARLETQQRELAAIAAPPASVPYAAASRQLADAAKAALDTGALIRAGRLARAAEQLTRADAMLLRAEGVRTNEPRGHLPPPAAPSPPAH